MNNFYKLGSMPSPPDDKDFPISRLVGIMEDFPEEFIRPYDGEIKVQGPYNMCVSESACYCLEEIEKRQSGKYKQLSPGFIYGNREETDYQEEGMYPRQALKNLQKYGTVEFDLFPYKDHYYKLKDQFNVFKNDLLPKAEPYRITSYCRLHGVNEIKSALMQLGPVTVCMPIYSNFYNLPYGNVVPMPSGEIEGYHEVTFFGWRKDNTWVTFNSWGEYWGDHGKCYMPFSFPITEAWSITDTILPKPEEITAPMPEEIVIPKPEEIPSNKKCWRIQIGAYKYEVNAIDIRDKILKKINKVKNRIFFIDNFYKIQLGEFGTEKEARELSKELTKLGIKNFITYC
jgi:hypothetical protein